MHVSRRRPSTRDEQALETEVSMIRAPPLNQLETSIKKGIACTRVLYMVRTLRADVRTEECSGNHSPTTASYSDAQVGK